MSSSRHWKMVSWWRSCPLSTQALLSSSPPSLSARMIPLLQWSIFRKSKILSHKFSFQVMTMFSANRDNNPKFWQCIAFVISGVLWWELTVLAVRYLPEISQPFACKLLSHILVRTWCTRENCFILTNIATIELSWIPVSTRCRSPPPSSSAGSWLPWLPALCLIQFPILTERMLLLELENAKFYHSSKITDWGTVCSKLV